jgi:hypothetical protein
VDPRGQRCGQNAQEIGCGAVLPILVRAAARILARIASRQPDQRVGAGGVGFMDKVPVIVIKSTAQIVLKALLVAL